MGIKEQKNHIDWTPQTADYLRSHTPALDFNATIHAPNFLKSFNAYLNFFQYPILNPSEAIRHHVGHLAVGEDNIFTQVWIPQSATITVFVCHGLFDHSGLYAKLLRVLLDEGYAVVMIDFPAHGLSSGDPKLVQSFNDYGSLLNDVLDKIAAYIPAKLIYLGQSTGAAALVNLTLRYPKYLPEKVILLAPLLRTTGWRRINWSYCLLHRFFSFVPRQFSSSSHDEEFMDLIDNRDFMQPRWISVRWVGAMRKWGTVLDKLNGSNMPTLIIQGDQDSTVDWQYNIGKFREKFSDLYVTMIPGAMHHLVNEDPMWRKKVFDEVVNFLK